MVGAATRGEHAASGGHSAPPQTKVDLSRGHSRARNVHDAFERIKQLGHGTYGEVYLAADRVTGEQVALKKIKLEASKERRSGFPITALREMRVLKDLSHRNVVALKEVCRSNVFACNGYKGSVYLIFEYLEHDLCGLHERIQKAAGARAAMDTAMVKSLAGQMLEGLAHCHRAHVLHRDLKASNLLIARDGTLKLADFGLARPFVTSSGRVGELTYRVCTLWYRPPELLLGSQSYGAEVDVWSAGCILYELLAGGPLFGGSTEAQMLTRIMDMLGPLRWPASGTIPAAASLKHFKQLPATAATDTFRHHCRTHNIAEDAIDLLATMLSLDPSRRPSAGECLRHPFFAHPPAAMSREDFLAATRNFTGSHEFVVKNKAAKRGRAVDPEGSTPDTHALAKAARPVDAGPPAAAQHAHWPGDAAHLAQPRAAPPGLYAPAPAPQVAPHLQVRSRGPSGHPAGVGSYGGGYGPPPPRPR